MTLLIFVSVLLASTQADIKILSTPDGKMGPEPCVRVCSGVDSDYSGWWGSGSHEGKVFKTLRFEGCDFVSVPVVTAMTTGGYGQFQLEVMISDFCPDLLINFVSYF